MRQLIVDSGVPNRGHRLNIFSRGYQAAGVGCARHSVYGAMCVIDFAGAIVQRAAQSDVKVIAYQFGRGVDYGMGGNDGHNC